MALETRDGRPYYYRKQRRGGRVVSEYGGSGELAEVLAELAARDQAERQAAAAAERQERAELAAVGDELRLRAEAIDALVTAALEAAGYHRHRREWRKRRGNRTDG